MFECGKRLMEEKMLVRGGCTRGSLGKMAWRKRVEFERKALDRKKKKMSWIKDVEKKI